MGTKEQLLGSSLHVILVYPFNNLASSNTGMGDNFSIALTESMISSLSRYSEIGVVSSSISLDAKEKNINGSLIRQMYNADFVIRGSIQTVSDRSRIHIQLENLKLNKVVWTDKVDFSATQIFEVQDRIGDKILKHMQINVVAGSEVKSWAAKYGNTERLTLFLNARKEWFKLTPDAYNNHTMIIRELEEQMGENNPVLYNIKDWNLFLKKVVGLSIDTEKDTNELIKLSNLDVAENQDVTAYNLRALVEFRLGSKNCDLSKKYAQKSH